jgi:outer membrane protein OmpA-like peptidoglycan-associated protein
MPAGAGFSFINGLNNRLDWQVTLDISFFDSLSGRKLEEKKLLGEGDVSLIAFLSNRISRIQPFVSVGAGFGSFASKYSILLPGSMGVRGRVFGEAFLLLQAQYRHALGQGIPSHYLFSVGVFGQIRRRTVNSQKRANYAPPVIAETAVTDRDRDGILDSLDACPDIPGMAAFQGCPDSDGDGIPNRLDSCPFQTGVAKYSGCPIPDSDKDGLHDEEDSCISMPGPRINNGCPLVDSDRDGIADLEDSCPSIPGNTQLHGCPVEINTLEGQVKALANQVHFDIGSDRLQSTSFPALDSLVDWLTRYPNIRAAIVGHTDNTHTAAFNQSLSESRARAVVDYLSGKGIERGRLSFRGFGDRFPVASNKTFAGRARNRRVEIVISW